MNMKTYRLAILTLGLAVAVTDAALCRCLLGGELKTDDDATHSCCVKQGSMAGGSCRVNDKARFVKCCRTREDRGGCGHIVGSI